MRHEVAVSKGNVNHNSVESRVSRGRVSIGEMKEPDSCPHCVIASQWDHHTRTKIESHVQPASIGKRDIVRETDKTSVNVEKRLPMPGDARRKLQPNRKAATIRVLAATRHSSRMDDKRFDVQIAANE